MISAVVFNGVTQRCIELIALGGLAHCMHQRILQDRVKMDASKYYSLATARTTTVCCGRLY